MRYLIIVLVAFVFVSCNKNFYKNSNVPKEGKYFNRKCIVYVFLKINNNIAYIDVIKFTKSPDFFYTDTIILNDNEKKNWHGELVALYEKNRRLIVRAPTHDFYGNINKEKTIDIVMKINNDDYDSFRDIYKNQALVNKVSSLLRSYDAIGSDSIYKELSIKYHQMRKKTLELKHEDFILEFHKFEQELIRELELLKEQYD